MPLIGKDAHHYFFTSPLHKRKGEILLRDISGLVIAEFKMLLFWILQTLHEAEPVCLLCGPYTYLTST